MNKKDSWLFWWTLYLNVWTHNSNIVSDSLIVLLGLVFSLGLQNRRLLLHSFVDYVGKITRASSIFVNKLNPLKRIEAGIAAWISLMYFFFYLGRGPLIFF